jgi:hypothetical protein
MLPAGKIFWSSIGQIGPIISVIFRKYWFVLLLPALSAYFTVIAFQSGYGVGDGGAKSFLIGSLFNFAFFLAQTPISISWTEKVVKKSEPILSFDGRVWSAWGYAFLILIILLAPIGFIIFAFMALGKEGGMDQYFAGTMAIVASLVWWGMTQRFCLVMPSIALRNASTRLGRSWNLTKGHNLKIVCIMLPVLVIVIMSSAIAQAISQALMFDQVSAVLSSVGYGVVLMATTMLWAEIQGRLFVFFLAPQKIGEYV